MIVDVHSHLFGCPDHFTPDFSAQAGRAHEGEVDLTVRWEEYAATAPEDTRTIVFGGKARLSGLWVDDADVARYAAGHAGRVIGFLSLDPTQPGWQDELRYGHRELGLRGVKLMPMYAGFDPGDPAFDPLWRYASEHGLPVLLHTGTTFVSQAPLEYARPGLADAVARRFPELRMILAHLGHPYEGECLAVIRKHPNVYADVSALHYRPYQLWHALMLAQGYGVWHKLLFGSDYPFTTVADSVAGLTALASVAPPSGLPGLNPDEIQRLIHRDSLALLGL
ncbi:amidohydrolase family protein [Spongiactinospora sp. TRM90649]|uniref:amidohydrolase family protein n=1 Tax=Spongiactinospora sp. TRM90649 TaxID=3031114 RepID=UPI0023F7FE92|nr:amidohydrolase family protein [Spongiactinospora sp. TRM90649]MDF5757030.1 amidohydrolase family protein [Spongiactinospora sp. TRM90649]